MEEPQQTKSNADLRAVYVQDIAVENDVGKLDKGGQYSVLDVSIEVKKDGFIIS